MSAHTSEQLLVRAFGTTLLAAAVVNIVVGGGIFALPGTLAKELGSAAPYAFIAGALLMIPVVLCFAAGGVEQLLRADLTATDKWHLDRLLAFHWGL